LSDGASIVHQSGDAAQFAVDALEQRNHFVFDADIGPYRNSLCAQCTNLLQHALRGLFIRLIVDADPIALRGSQQRRRGANTAPAAGDHNDFIHAGLSPDAHVTVGGKNNRHWRLLHGVCRVWADAFASKLAPTGVGIPNVRASLLAKNDNPVDQTSAACCSRAISCMNLSAGIGCPSR
jgi:hypothetical protein